MTFLADTFALGSAITMRKCTNYARAHYHRHLPQKTTREIFTRQTCCPTGKTDRT